MPVVDVQDYNPGALLKFGHLNTIYPFLFRRMPIPLYHRIRMSTPDEDFIDIDTIFRNNKRLVILCHGLEGSAHSKYIIKTADLLSKSNCDVISMNYRGCSGELNKGIKMYHSGMTQDLHMIIEKYKSGYDEISLVGFSLGGNMVMKYISDGIYKLDEKISSCVGISVPCDLHAGSLHIGRWQNYMYERRFLIDLSQKVRLKKEIFPDLIDLDLLNKVNSLFDFDDKFTAPIHGFEDAEDYYYQCNCKQFLKNIKIPALIISALDDPFLPKISYPFAEAEENPNFFFMAPNFGGHVGFTKLGHEHYWEEIQIQKFIDDPTCFS